MRRKSTKAIDHDRRREDALRPHPRLGYDHDGLGVYLLSCEAYEIAEGEFRRAIWLNPFEPLFKQHLAMCLYAQGRRCEALDCATASLSQHPDSQELKRTVRLLRRGDRRASATPQRPEDTCNGKKTG